MPIITCPHCGARRNTPQHKLPNKPVSACCPECRGTFSFNPTDKPFEMRDPAATAVFQTITCPKCGLPREIPSNRYTNRQATVTCRRCSHAFRLKQGEPNPAAATESLRKLTGIGRLLAGSWELFCRRGWGLLGINLLACLLLIVPLLGAALFLPELSGSNQSLVWSGLFFGTLYGILAAAWLTASLFSFTCDNELGIVTALKRGWQQLWKFAGILLLLVLILAGGSLLLIVPGIIFAVWFLFCQYILADEGSSGLQALEKSRQLVRGHWWPVFGRALLLLLISLILSTLTSRLPAVGPALNVILVLLLFPFSLQYFFLIYQDLKRCRRQSDQPSPSGLWLAPASALVGWMLIPALLFFANNRQTLDSALYATENSAIIAGLLGTGQNSLLDREVEESAQRRLPHPEHLTLADYDRLLSAQQLQAPRQGINLGPATLSAEHFWADEQEPHLWLKLQLADLPNLALSHRRSTRIVIDKVLDAEAKNRYDQGHCFENTAFHWINILPSDSSTDGYDGIRNVYLKQGTRPEQIRSISGQLELNLPLGIEALTLERTDIGKTLQVAGKMLTLEALGKNGIALRFRGKISELLSIRAVDRQATPLREAGTTWQQIGETINFKQMFSGDIDTVTVLVASDSVTRSYPFEITR